MSNKYQELEVDSHNIATHWIDREGVECWAENKYYEDGRFKDVRIFKIRFPRGWTSCWFGHTKKENEMYTFDESNRSTRDIVGEVFYQADHDVSSEFKRMYNSGEAARLIIAKCKEAENGIVE